MGKICILILIFYFGLISCNKSKKETKSTSCKNLSMIGDLSRLTGKWKWISTTLIHSSSFDCNVNSSSAIYPTDVNYTFKLEVTNNGQIRIIKNDTLIDVLNFTGVNQSIDQFKRLHAYLNYNCSDKNIFIENSTGHDSIYIELPHLNFNNSNQTIHTDFHLFVRN